MRRIATPIKLTGSVEVTPKSKLFMNCVIGAAPITPIKRPTTENLAPSLTTSCTTSCGCARSAIRMPISVPNGVGNSLARNRRSPKRPSEPRPSGVHPEEGGVVKRRKASAALVLTFFCKLWILLGNSCRRNILELG